MQRQTPRHGLYCVHEGARDRSPFVLQCPIGGGSPFGAPLLEDVWSEESLQFVEPAVERTGNGPSLLTCSIVTPGRCCIPL